MTPFFWGMRGGMVTVTEGSEPTLKNQGWGTRKSVSVEGAEGRLEGGATKKADPSARFNARRRRPYARSGPRDDSILLWRGAGWWRNALNPPLKNQGWGTRKS